MEQRLVSALQEAIKFLEHHGYRYAVIGGLALSQWGAIRVTRDVDIKVHVPDTDYDSIRKAISAVFPKHARQNIPENSLIVSVKIKDVIVDFLLALPGYEELIIERAIQREIDGRMIWICSAEDLIIQKAVAGRARDWPDIEALLIEQHGKLNDNYIDNWLTQFAEVLDKPDLIIEFQKIRKKIEDSSSV